MYNDAYFCIRKLLFDVDYCLDTYDHLKCNSNVPSMLIHIFSKIDLSIDPCSFSVIIQFKSKNIEGNYHTKMISFEILIPQFLSNYCPFLSKTRTIVDTFTSCE